MARQTLDPPTAATLQAAVARASKARTTADDALANYNSMGNRAGWATARFNDRGRAAAAEEAAQRAETYAAALHAAVDAQIDLDRIVAVRRVDEPLTVPVTCDATGRVNNAWALIAPYNARYYLHQYRDGLFDRPHAAEHGVLIPAVAAEAAHGGPAGTGRLLTDEFRQGHRIDVYAHTHPTDPHHNPGETMTETGHSIEWVVLTRPDGDTVEVGGVRLTTLHLTTEPGCWPI